MRLLLLPHSANACTSPRRTEYGLQYVGNHDQQLRTSTTTIDCRYGKSAREGPFTYIRIKMVYTILQKTVAMTFQVQVNTGIRHYFSFRSNIWSNTRFFSWNNTPLNTAYIISHFRIRTCTDHHLANAMRRKQTIADGKDPKKGFSFLV